MRTKVDRPFSSLRARWRTMFSTITTAPSTTMPKSSAPSESRLAGICLRSRQVAAKSSEKGMVSATISAPRTLPRKRNRMMATRIMPSVKLCSTVCVVKCKQFAAIDERRDLDALGQDLVVQLLAPFGECRRAWAARWRPSAGTGCPRPRRCYSPACRGVLR